jgi:energy-coupling factor transporter ATP-binding protein EcfA2/type II secretory pathway pseudopilin PulG
MDTTKNRGSVWRKWDLHVHTPESDGYKGTWKEFKKQLESADCDVIGINDYFSIAGYTKIKEEIDKGTLDIGSKVVLPVVEMRMTDLLQNRHTTTGGATSFNFHLIFSDELDVADIENFIKSLESDDTTIGSDYNDKSKLKNKKVAFSDTLKKLNKDKKFINKFLIWIPYDEYGGIGDIDPCSDKWIKAEFIKKSHILGSSNQKQIDFFLWKSSLKKDGTPKFTQTQFESWFGSKKPCVKGSDSHSDTDAIGKLKDKDSKPIEKSCWIKADSTFEGLKQITYEPANRVFIGENKPKQPINTINSISLNFEENAKVGDNTFCFAGKNRDYQLSPYFNCFVGGRGSGKSTLLNFLGNHAKDKSSSDSFWSKLKPSFDSTDRNIFNFYGTEDFEFLGQSEIESFATDKEKFTQAIYNRANAKSSNALDSYEKGIKESKKKLDDIIQLVKEVKELTTKKEGYTKEKTTLENSLKIIKSEEYKELTQSISGVSEKRKALTQWKDKVSDLLEKLVELNDKNNSIDVTSKEGREKAYYSAKNKIQEAIELLKTDFSDDDSKENELTERLEEFQEKLANIAKKSGYTNENLSQIQQAPQRISELDSDIKELDKDIKQKTDKINGLDNLIQEANTIKSDFENEINAVLAPLQNLLKSEFEKNSGVDIKHISLEYGFDTSNACKTFANEFYNFFAKPFNFSGETKVVRFISENEKVFLEGNKEEIVALLRKDDYGTQYMDFLKKIFEVNSNFLIFKSIRAKHLYDVKASAKIDVIYGDKSIEHASFGQKCTSVIVILLLFGTAPLIIDEPEAHLDSSLIANYLVPLLKQKKNERQIIFATHNANFVINGDAEKIFVLKNDDNKTRIIETTIENTKHRDELLKLEGGKEAFEKRGYKLNIK